MRLIPGGCRALASQAARLPRLLLCLAPHGVCLAPAITHRPVGSYPAFSPLPADFSTGGLFSVTLSVAASFRKAAPPFSGACCLWCPDFPPNHRHCYRVVERTPTTTPNQTQSVSPFKPQINQQPISTCFDPKSQPCPETNHKSHKHKYSARP